MAAPWLANAMDERKSGQRLARPTTRAVALVGSRATVVSSHLLRAGYGGRHAGDTVFMGMGMFQGGILRHIPPEAQYGRASTPSLAQSGGLGGGMEPSQRVSTPNMGGGALIEALGPGTLLKGGRYRLLQRLHPAGATLPQGNEPPPMIASDAELPGDRVLVQELSLVGVRIEDAENARRLLARRLEQMAQTPGVAKLVDHFSERRRHFLVFELPSGEFLFDRMQRAHDATDETVAVGYALQALDVLAGLERQQPPFIHGNIGPANILLRPSGQVVLVGCSPLLLLYPDGNVPQGPASGSLAMRRRSRRAARLRRARTSMPSAR